MFVGAHSGPRVRVVGIAVAALFLVATFAARAAWADHMPPEPTVSGLKPAKVRASKLKPGLGVTYYMNRFNNTDELLIEAEITKGRKGKPLPQLNYKVGRGNVLTTNRENMVGAMIRGHIRFAKKGVYTLLLQSNDGVVLTIAGKQIYADPGVHPDDFSPPLKLQIDTPGWYRIEITYFEKKSTATLELYWQEPGAAGDPVFVPAAAFAHIPK